MLALVAVVVLVFGLPLLMYMSVRTGDLARIDVVDGAVIIRPRGLNRVWALKSEVRVPLADVAEFRPAVARRDVPSGLRIPGTSFPGIIQAGTYRQRGERSFWLVGRTSQVAVIECRTGRFDRIVLQVSDETALKVRAALTGPSPSG